MRSATTRFIILASAVLIAVVLAVQVYWLDKTHRFEENEFNTSVLKSIRGLYEDMPLLYNSQLSLDSLVEKYHRSGFLFQVHNLPPKDSLLFYLSAEMEDFRVFTDCRVALYDETRGKFDYEAYLSTDGSRQHEDSIKRLPVLTRGYNYVLLYFPHRGNYIISQMKNWIYTSVVLLLLLTGFSFALYYFYKQKFLVEVQKDFINNVTHEFSTPLSVLELATAGLEKPGIASRPDKISKYTVSIRHQLDYLKSHIQNLVETVVADNYQFRLNRERVIPNEILRKAFAQLQPLLEKKEGRLYWQLEPGNTALPGDEENLYLAFFNCISNAIKYAPEPVIMISTSAGNGSYQVRISDNGPGIEQASQKKIFRKFYRVPQGNLHAVKGLGLGLYFTYKVIKAHGGHIRVKSEAGKGAEFIIDLPLK